MDTVLIAAALGLLVGLVMGLTGADGRTGSDAA